MCFHVLISCLTRPLYCLQYEDEALGELDDEDAAKARNNAKISDFAGMLDDFLLEQAEMEALQVLGRNCL